MRNLDDLNDEDTLYELRKLSDIFDSTIYRLGIVKDNFNDYVD